MEFEDHFIVEPLRKSVGGESMFLFSLPTSFNCPSWDINYSHAMKVSSFWSCRYFNLGLQKRMPSNCNVHYITAHLEPFIFTNSMVFFFFYTLNLLLLCYRSAYWAFAYLWSAQVCIFVHSPYTRSSNTDIIWGEYKENHGVQYSKFNHHWTFVNTGLI